MASKSERKAERREARTLARKKAMLVLSMLRNAALPKGYTQEEANAYLDVFDRALRGLTARRRNE